MGGKKLEKADVEECCCKDQRKDVAVQKVYRIKAGCGFFFFFNTRWALLCIC